MPLRRTDWVRLKDKVTEITHHAYPHGDDDNQFITICNLIVTIGENSRWIILRAEEELTCEDCIRWISMGPIDETLGEGK